MSAFCMFAFPSALCLPAVIGGAVNRAVGDVSSAGAAFVYRGKVVAAVNYNMIKSLLLIRPVKKGQ